MAAFLEWFPEGTDLASERDFKALLGLRRFLTFRYLAPQHSYRPTSPLCAPLSPVCQEVS
ncbi:hypothetical protein [Ferrimicrobium acidiphilum]|uniref:hypothetical protein n=1 Tax=Ferrimicrobium acidiphilum TaxID=121039 RepID=UPI0023F1917C|nr:hypothetical protein [Ferrimicrobium acidiphilum]